MPRLTEPKLTKPKRVGARKSAASSVVTAAPVLDDRVVDEVPTSAPPASPDRSTLLWGSVIVIVLLIVGIWVVVFRWSIAHIQPSLTASSLSDVKSEVQKNLGDFQKNFEHITRLIEDRFAVTAPTATGTVRLSPDALRDLQERIEKTAQSGEGDRVGTENNGDDSISLDVGQWQQFRDTALGMTFRYPDVFTLNTPAIRDARIAAFARRLADGTVRDRNEFVVDVHPNPTRKSLKEFYTEPGRFNIYGAATGGTDTVYVDGIRAVLFHAVANVTSVTVVGVRRGTRVYEFSVLGAEQTHEALIKKIIGTVRFQ